MTLELIDHRAPTAVRDSWTPFPSSEDYEHSDWWRDAGGAVGDPWFVEVREHGVQVARVQLDERSGINPSYVGTPAVADGELLEIQNIEVAVTARGDGIGSRVVHALVERHPDRRLMAYSAGAATDRFWMSVGWDPFYESRRGPAGGTLFIQPHTLKP
ncbi:GNAT family N-acetyltransferase [Mycobacteroides chelonae]|uniref:GNAT family N-acetyltransferase n=1 Tax=Mycobacteroides chelonae TaxID=1774 RepID=UPI000993ACF6|nr:GNAT family N-acetyltransferase [Mycobacteroides chelonae]